MEFGRVHNIDAVNFNLPETHQLSKQVLSQLNKEKLPKVYIGCPVWADKGYVGKVFPPKTPAKNYLREYCKQFNSIEVNATHYQIPTADTIKKWRDVATPGFKFCPKFPQHISHRTDFDEKDEWVDLFLTSIYGLGEHLGTSFIQFPPHFKPNKMGQLDNFFKKLPQDLSFAMEVRNEAWFEDESIKKEWFDLLKYHYITPVITDTSGRRDVLHQMITNQKVFIRFTGNNLHLTDFKRVDDWIERIKEWVELGVSELYFFVHEPTKHFCADIASYMIEKLTSGGNYDLKIPHDHTKNFGTLF